MLNALRHQRLLHKGGKKDGVDLRSAQRLTASEVIASGAALVLVISLMCSTPYGIRGYCISGKSTGNTSSTRAQRLTASEVIASAGAA